MRLKTRGFSLLELLVVIAIVCVLVGIGLPAIQEMRELSRRSKCERNLVRLSLALSAYSLDQTHYPVGTLDPSSPIKNVADGYHHNWVSALLPMLDEETAYSAIDSRVSVYDPANESVRNLSLEFLLCPTAGDTKPNSSSYAGIHASREVPIAEDNDGVFRLNVPIGDADITDGSSFTIFLAEKLSHPAEDLGWMSGTRSTLRNTGLGINGERARIRQKPYSQEDSLYVGGIASDHVGGAYILFGSGKYEFRSELMDHQMLAQLASIADGPDATGNQDEVSPAAGD